MSYSYNNYTNPYARNYQMPNYVQPQYTPQMQQPIVQQPQSMPMQQPMQYEVPIQYVGNGTLKEAEGYILFPNQKAIFIDKASGMVYEKVCGNDGQSFMSSYKKVDSEQEKIKEEPVKEESAINMAEFATKTDLKGFVTVEQYKQLKEMFDGLKGQINGLKQINKTKTVKDDDKEA